ncbi:MAG: class B sortase [Ruminococcus sp.]|nr:class B sortase [Ruminococcus sp.]
MSDNINENEIIPDGSEHLSKEDKIKAIKKSVKISSNDWDGERSALFSEKVHKVMDSRLPWSEDELGVLDDMPEDAVPSEEIYAGIGLGDLSEIIPDSDIPLFDENGVPLNGTSPEPEPEPYIPQHEAEPVPEYVPQHEAEPVQEETPVLAALRQQEEEFSANGVYEPINDEPDRSYSEPAEPDKKLYTDEQPDYYSEPPVRQAPKKKKRRKKSTGEKIRDLFPRKGDGALESIRKIVFLVSLVAIVVCGYLVADYYIDLWHSKSVNKDMMEMYWTYPDKHDEGTVEEASEKYYELLDGARKLLDVNPDVVGVISIPDTPINNPVMKADDNFKYLDMKINGDYSRAGELFMDYRNKFDHVIDHRLAEPNSDNIVVYGHNMGDLTMFGCLQHYKTEDDYYTKHPLIYFNSNYESYVYKIFAFFILDSGDKSENAYDCWNTLDFANEDEFYDFVNEAKRRTFRLNEVDVKYGDPLLTLSTCNNVLGENGRFIVMARRVREGEDYMEGTQKNRANPNVKWPDFYYKIRTDEKYDPDAEFIPYGPDKAEE